MKIAVVDIIANVGAGQRFAPNMLEGLTQACPECEIRFVTDQAHIAEKAFAGLDRLPIQITEIVTGKSLPEFLQGGRWLGIPGTWKLKTTLKSVLSNRLPSVEHQLRKAISGVDLVYHPWPDFSTECIQDVPAVMTLHDLLWHHVPVLSPTQSELLDGQVSHWLSKCAATVAITDALRREIQDTYPAQAKQIQVIHQAAPVLPSPLSGGERQGWVARAGITRSYALCPAGLWLHKNHENLIRAFGLLKRRGDHPLLVCSGKYTDEAFGGSVPARVYSRAAELRDLAGQVGLVPGEDIIGVGNVSDVELATLYAAADFVIMPSTTEGGSFPILEAASLEKPVACSDIEVYREQASYFSLSPMYFDPLDASSIARAVEYISRGSISKGELAQQAALVRARTWRTVAEEYLTCFRSVIREGVQ